MARKKNTAQETQWTDPAMFLRDVMNFLVADRDPAANSSLPETDDPIEMLLAVMNHPGWELAARVSAADSLMPYFHGRAYDEDEDDDDCSALFADDDNRPVTREQMRVNAAIALLPYTYPKIGAHDDEEAAEAE